jgi:DNA (cytosine-5)-methyltransferase 1
MAIRSANIISLCTGGGGLDLGVELAMPCARSVCLVEREAFAVSQLVCSIQQGLMAEAAIWSDVTTFNGRPWRGIVDGVIGGIPCQPHSLAGKREGEEDERDLWSDARRIIVQSGAWFAIIENVGGMLTAKPGLDPGALRVRRDLQRLGFDVEGGLFTAAEVGASHERERVFILAVADCDSQPRGGQHEFGGSRRERRHGDDGHQSGRVNEGAQRSIGEGGLSVVDPSRKRRGEGQSKSGIRSGRHSIGGANGAVADAGSGLISIEGRRSKGRNGAGSASPVFPPGPSDLSSWLRVLESTPELEPAFRRVADGLASRLDVARVDRLRMLGNGVVPLQAAYALRTLASRLAEGGSAGAARLVHLMEGKAPT